MLDQQLNFTASQLQMARELFEVACSEPGRRDAILDEGCRGDLQLRALVEDLIEADSQPHPILDHPLCLSEPRQKVGSDSLAPGAQIGPYRVVREIAVGGMGAIYLAERADASATKRFALKVIRWWSPDVSRRFQQEEAILKRLRHPNIAQIVDSDTSNGNNPYLVMEYVEGQPIHSYCTQKLLSVDDRILLFRQICAAVRYLHQNLVVHRDLKPGNVLVTADGSVKLVDFGIAKLLEEPGGNRSPRNTTLGLMTPNYASPEQVRGVATSTLTDVYSLGLLLYELLTGVNPFAARGIETHEILRRICEEEAERPSVAASRAVVDRKMRRALVRSLRGELDNVILKSIRKDPEQRYASVEQFDEDLRRYLHDLPVVAQGFSFSYRTRKFLSRYRAAVAAGATMFLLLAGGVVATSFEARIASKERARAEAHARLAEVAKAVADQERATAEMHALEAQRQKTVAERRLAELQKLAHGAAQIYAATREGSGSADASLIAHNSRDLLMTLRRENALEPGVGLTLRALADQSSSATTADDSWHIPVGWEAGESSPHEYSISVDHRVVHGGKSSLLLHSIVPRPRGDAYVLQTFAADRFVGKRVRLSVYMKPENVSDEASLLLIVHTRGVDHPLFLRETTSGTSKWTRLEIVADAPPDAVSIAIGVDLRGAGTVRADDVGFSSVSHAVPLTNLEPKNLDFRRTTN